MTSPAAAPPKYRIVIADDSMILREGLARLFTEAGFDVIATFPDAVSLISEVHRLSPDLVVLDVRMPPTFTDEGVRAAVQLRTGNPDLSVLLLSQYAEVDYATELFSTGRSGAGYLLKDRVASIDELREAVVRIVGGGTVIDESIVQQLFSRKRDPLATLSAREVEVLSLMAEGRTNSSIASLTHLSVGSIEKYSTTIFTKLQLDTDNDAHRRVLAVLAWLNQSG
jgi:DNA-binding NarL/FixJ family response regulator